MALEVVLDARPAGPPEPDVFSLRVDVGGGRAPLRLLLYVDGELASACDSVADIYEFRASGLTGARRALTVRVIDADGRWGSASRLISGGVSDVTSPLRIMLRSSVKSRPLVAGL